MGKIINMQDKLSQINKTNHKQNLKEGIVILKDEIDDIIDKLEEKYGIDSIDYYVILYNIREMLRTL